MLWDHDRLDAVEAEARTCTSGDACTPDVLALVTEVRRQRSALADIQFDLINCHEAASRNACVHIKDAIRIVNLALST